MNKNERILIDDKDKKILNVLLENSKLSYRDIGKKTKLSPVTVMNRVDILQKKGIIQGYTIELDYDKLGYDTQAIIQLRIQKGKLFEVERKIATHPNVFGVYDTTGEFDTIIVAKFKSRSSLDSFLKKVQTYDFIERTHTRIVLNTIKEKNIAIS